MPEPAQQPQAAQRGNGEGNSFWRTAIQSVGMFLAIQFVMKNFMGSGSSSSSSNKSEASSSTTAPITSFSDRPALNSLEGKYSAIPELIAPLWAPNTTLDITVYVSPSLVMPSFQQMSPESLVLEEKKLQMGDYKDSRDIQTTIDLPVEVQRNGSLWAHIYVGHAGAVLDPTKTNYDSTKSFHVSRSLTQYLMKKKVAKTRNLLGGSEDASSGVEQNTDVPAGPTVASYFHPNFTLSIVPDTSAMQWKSLQPAIREWVQLERTGARDSTGKNAWYYPVIYMNTFWQLRDHMTEINETVTTLPLNIHLNNLANWKFSIISSLDFGMKQNQQKIAAGESLPGGGDGSELEEVKRILLDSNPYLLATTFIVGILHTIFEMLAFKNDVSHWRNKKDNIGISFRTILVNVFTQAIIFLYLLDNNENTSYVILFSQGLGIVLEAWKVTKTVNVRLRPTDRSETRIPWRFLPYTIVFEDKHKLSETEEKTQEYDKIAFQYLWWVAIPLLGAYAGYSLYYQSHKSWYSFILTTLVGSVYAYGFLMMVPSLYINYRLKSVAHMPGRTMTYKFLNTFIDDLFAFTVKMPTLHRLATLRDDVIFFVYLYQRYKYKTDYTRVNEFGQGGDDESVADKVASQPLKSPTGGEAVDVPSTPGDKAKASGREGNGNASTKKRK